MDPASKRGQILPVAISILVILAILLPLMVRYTQLEALWSVKQNQSAGAFHLAEAGIEKGYLILSLSTQTWVTLQLGTPPTNYNFDKVFSDMGTGGTYTVSITSGPGRQQATVISVGRDRRLKEVRALKAVYSNAPLGGTAIYAGKGAQIGGGVNVEWGAVISPYSIDSAGRAHPQFWSAASIVGFDTDPNPANCDGNCCQWHSHYAGLPPAPTLDLQFYKSSATASSCSTTGSHSFPSGASPAGSCYFPAAATFKDVGTASGQTIYVDGDLTVQSPGIDIVGNLLVAGNLNLPNGAWGYGNHAMSIPSDAWKQYCNDWDFYRTNFDGGADASFPGLTSSYAPTGLTLSSSRLAVYGLLYVGGNFNNGGGGGGNSDIYGVLYSIGSSSQTANSGVTFYFNPDGASGLQSTQIILSRVSWQDLVLGWPATAH